jgi:hypothetical protein
MSVDTQGGETMGFTEWWATMKSCFREVDEYDAERIWYASMQEEQNRCAKLAENYSAALADEIRRG